jgi:hypothetical protein
VHVAAEERAERRADHHDGDTREHEPLGLRVHAAHGALAVEEAHLQNSYGYG